MKLFLRKDQTLRVTFPDPSGGGFTYQDFRNTDAILTMHFDGGSLILTRDQDKELVKAWGSGKWFDSEIVG